MKNILKPNAIPTSFKNGPPQAKKLKRHDKNVSQEAGAGPSKHAQRPPRGAYRKRKLLGYVKEEIKAYVNQFKVRKTGSEN